jgi:alanine racemase
MGLSVPLNNLANSAGIMGYREAHFDMVRPGIMLYGGYPCPEFQSLATLRPVMHFKGQVIQVKNLPDASPVSYGRTYHTTGQQTIAVISAGYGDGLPRSLSSVGKVLIGGKKVPILGRVCMNMIMADVSGSRGIRAGDEAVFLGLQGEEMIAGDDMASWAGTIAYEVFCSLGQRNKKEYRQ